MNHYLLTILVLLLIAVAAIGFMRSAARADNELLREAVQLVQIEAERDGVTWRQVIAFIAVCVAIATLLFVGVQP